MNNDLKELQSAADGAGLEMEFLELRAKAEHAERMLAALKQINDWCCYATEEDVAARLLALQQIGQLARGAMTSEAGND